MPAAALVVGQLALGIGLVFVRSRPVAPHLDHRAVDRVSLRLGQRAAQFVEFDQHIVVQQQFARRVRRHRPFDVAFERELTAPRHAERAVSGAAEFPRSRLTEFSPVCALIGA